MEGRMELDAAIKILRKAVKHTGTIDQKHIDLTVIPNEERPIYEKALAVAGLAIKEGKITRDDFLRKVNLEH